MKKTGRKYLGIIFVIIFIVTITHPVVFSVQAEDSFCQPIVPSSVIVYAKSVFPVMNQSIMHNADLNMAITTDEDAKLDNPFIIYNADTYGVQTPIYYFPVKHSNKIQYLLYVTFSPNKEYSAGITSEWIGLLNQYSYMSNPQTIIYIYNKRLYFETKKTITSYSVDTYTEPTSTKLKKNEFINSTYETKKSLITSTYGKNDNSTVPITSLPQTSGRGFSVYNAYQVKLKTDGCLVSQGSYGLCWAASVATTVRYLNYSSYHNLTAMQVADRMGIGYNTGATDSQKISALSKYGVNYKNCSYVISFPSIKNEIRNEYPVMMSCYSSNSGHSLTIIGYSTYGGINQIIYHNSGTNTVSSVAYSGSNTSIAYNNSRYIWKTTQCH